MLTCPVSPTPQEAQQLEAEAAARRAQAEQAQIDAENARLDAERRREAASSILSDDGLKTRLKVSHESRVMSCES